MCVQVYVVNVGMFAVDRPSDENFSEMCDTLKRI